MCLERNPMAFKWVFKIIIIMIIIAVGFAQFFFNNFFFLFFLQIKGTVGRTTTSASTRLQL
jgi:hypothetical protein